MKKTSLIALLLCLTASLLCAAPGDARAAGAWIASWDFRRGVEEAERNPGIDEVIFFAASFNSQDTLFLPITLIDYFQDELAASPLAQRQVFLSIVNDRFDDANGAVQKDPDLISRLMADEHSRAKHKADILALLDYGDFAGLELDYERVPLNDWPTLLAFAEDLAADLNARGKRLRFVLEPKKRYLDADLPSGPEYVLMTYNLYGFHSGPGPKTNFAFLEQLAAWCAHLREKPRVALSTGGFAWEHDTVVSLTEQAVQRKTHLLKAEPRRDDHSEYLALHVENKTAEPRSLTEFVRGVYTEIWYADGQTLAALANRAKQHGFAVVDIWRLGENKPETLSRALEASK